MLTRTGAGSQAATAIHRTFLYYRDLGTPTTGLRPICDSDNYIVTPWGRATVEPCGMAPIVLVAAVRAACLSMGVASATWCAQPGAEHGTTGRPPVRAELL
jgi:hypothetical protein